MAACKVGALQLPPTDQALLAGWMATGKDAAGRAVSAVLMARALSAEGHGVSATAVKDHRGGRCVCRRED